MRIKQKKYYYTFLFQECHIIKNKTVTYGHCVMLTSLMPAGGGFWTVDEFSNTSLAPLVVTTE